MIALLVAAGDRRWSSRCSSTPLFIRLFRRLNWGQFIRDDGPTTHHAKRGTPTMGGIVFISARSSATFVGKLVAREQPSTIRAARDPHDGAASASSASSTTS